jgi:hypothetical protein
MEEMETFNLSQLIMEETTMEILATMGIMAILATMAILEQIADKVRDVLEIL